ncbi:MAG: metallophosphoesterase family protein [Lentisphaerae bacterium]|nr:metallophosphoesterase family protein [Lentisphaerota bacterium]
MLAAGGAACALAGTCLAADFRVTPYLQNPTTNAITIMWLAEADVSGVLGYAVAGGTTTTVQSAGTLASVLDYHSTELAKSNGNRPLPWLHQQRLTNLAAGTRYAYQVTQGGTTYTNTFRTAPDRNTPIRFALYADSEAEPESTGVRVNWDNPASSASRLYLIDQTTGYASNTAALKTRDLDFLIIAGDLVEAGGEQRDWDEFWRHNAGAYNDLAGGVPIFAALGNHEYYPGTRQTGGQGYNQPGSEQSVAKFLTYFDNPPNGRGTAEQQERFYRIDYGPATIIVLDTCNGNDAVADQDTSLRLFASTGSKAPDFNPGSVQYQWLVEQLADAQLRNRFTFVVFHHTPYSAGIHGDAVTGDNQLGSPVKLLTPVMLQFGVDAILCGHDELLERSVVSGSEALPGGGTNAYDLHVYDYGVGGDGLRGPDSRVTNPQQAFLAHTDAPEDWSGGVLQAGGKHYGHLEVNIARGGGGEWTATLTPVHLFPRMTAGGAVVDVERRVYADEVVLTAAPDPVAPPDPLIAGIAVDNAMVTLGFSNLVSASTNHVLHSGTAPWTWTTNTTFTATGATHDVQIPVTSYPSFFRLEALR